jgi:hypothetical protein
VTPIEIVLPKLSGVKKVSHGWLACCPAHEDRKPSLSISESADGRVLMKCHAGCTLLAIVSALGMTPADLFPRKHDPTSNHNGKPKAAGTRPNGKPESAGRVFRTAKDAVAELVRQHGTPSVVWTYRDAQGEPVGLVVRWDGPDGKDIRPVARHADGWRIGMMPDPRPLYDIPKLATARRVVVCEGEKAADAARSIGFTATTSAGGSQAAAKTNWRPLAGRRFGFCPTTTCPAGSTRRPWRVSLRS